MISARRVGDFPSNTESANQSVTNGNAGILNESSQSESKGYDLLSFKRKIEDLSTEDSPSKLKMQADTVYHVLLSEDNVQVVKEPKIFTKLDSGPGRSGISPDLVDFAANMQVEGGTSANRVARAKEIHDSVFKIQSKWSFG
jgi:hypothetical protein